MPEEKAMSTAQLATMPAVRAQLALDTVLVSRPAQVQITEETPYAEIDAPHWIEIAAELALQQPANQPVRGVAVDPARNYVVMLASGPEDEGKRATLAFSAACTALSLNLDTQVFLIGDGSHWGYEGTSAGIHQKGFPPLGELIDTFLELGGEVYICAACDGVCSLPGPDGSGRQRRREIQPRGLAAVLSHMVGGSSLTF
jgi:predicted peroxiredoxin